MNTPFKLTVLASSLLAAGLAQAATVTFTGMAAAYYGKANFPSSEPGPDAGGCYEGKCFVQDGVVVGGVQDLTDPSAHYHRQGSSSDREAQYHPDSTGIYVRREDYANFSLLSLNLRIAGEDGGNFVIYGYADANDPPKLLQSTPFGGGAYASTDPDWGSVTPVATYVFPNNPGPEFTLDLTTLGPDFGNIGAFWLHFQGFNHSPTVNYDLGTYPDWDIRIDDIVLGDPVLPPPPIPAPAAFWLFGPALAGIGALARRKA